MSGVVESEQADVARAAKFEAVDSAIGRDYPRRCLCVVMYGPEQKEREIADRTGMRKYRYTLALMGPKDGPQLPGDPLQ